MSPLEHVEIVLDARKQAIEAVIWRRQCEAAEAMVPAELHVR
jgi:hypothetical protein